MKLLNHQDPDIHDVQIFSPSNHLHTVAIKYLFQLKRLPTDSSSSVAEQVRVS
jgi:hypothetical protein